MAQLKHVATGDSLKIPVGDWNAMIDTARAFRGGQLPAPPRSGDAAGRPDLVYVRNDSGADIDQFNIFGVDDSIFSPATELAGFQQSVALTGVTPTDDHGARFVILAAPIAAGAIGLAYADGVCPVKVAISDTDHTTAEIADGVTANLKSSSSGPAQILWAESGTGTKWAVVRFAGSGLPPGGTRYQVLQIGVSGPIWDYVRAH